MRQQTKLLRTVKLEVNSKSKCTQEIIKLLLWIVVCIPLRLIAFQENRFGFYTYTMIKQLLQQIVHTTDLIRPKSSCFHTVSVSSRKIILCMKI